MELLAGAIIFLVIAVLFLALAIVFRQELRIFLGSLALIVLIVWLTAGLTWWAALLAMGLAAIITVVSQHMDQRRRQVTDRPGMTPQERYLAELRYQYEHGQLSDEQYEQALTAAQQQR